jgi:hypothetical protein
MRQGVAEVDEQAIAEILRDMPVKAGNHLGAGVLIRPHHLTQVFRVELACEGSRVRQVTKQHGELPAFGVQRLGGEGWDGHWVASGSQRDGVFQGLRGCRRRW